MMHFMYRVVVAPRGVAREFIMLKPPGGCTLIFSYIRRLGSFYGFKILNFNILGVFRKTNEFWGVKILWIFFGGHPKIGL